MRNRDALYDLIEEVTGHSPRTAPTEHPSVTVTGAGGGGGKGGGGSASSAPDTLFSTATIRIVDLLCEGPIKGVVGGLKGVYLNDVPVQNEDGTFNFKGLTAEFRNGEPGQTYMAGYPDVQTPQNVGIKVNQPTPVRVSVTDTAANRVRVTVQIPALFLSKNDGSVASNSVTYRILARYSGGPAVNELGDITVTGKTTSGYLRSHEVTLPRNPNGASAPWFIDLVRVSPDTDDFNNRQDKYTNQSDIIFHSVTNIVDAKFSYPHSAVVGLTAQASSFGSSMPTRRYLVEGTIMPVPSNYDPVARTYAGIWDGTFKEAYCNNPAWALNLILSNKRFGLGEFIDVAAIDKWSLYEIGRYCDQLIPDGKGGMEPRATFNGVIENQQDAFELLQLVAQVFRGLVYWSAGTVTAAQDRPRDPVMVLTEANVVRGEFNYSSSSIRARHTVALVRWHDPENMFKPTLEVVEDEEGIRRYGYNPTRIDMVGCTSRGQAHRAGKWILFTELQQTQILSYQAGLDHAPLRPGDVVVAMDPSVVSLGDGADLGGRLLAGSTTTELKLDRTINLLPNETYQVSVIMPDGSVAERVVTTAPGLTSSLSLGPALPQAPDPAAVWVAYGPIDPRQFSIVSIYEAEPHLYSVSALQYEPGKFAHIDEGVEFEPTNFSDFPNKVEAPVDLSVRESQYTDLGVVRQALTLSWRPANPFNISGYYVTAIRPSGSVLNLPRTVSISTDIIDVEPGLWTFVVTAVGLNGKSSLPATLEYAVVGWQGQLAATVTGLQVRGGGAVFSGRSCTMQWTNTFPQATSPYPVTNVVYVYDASTNQMVHREALAVGQTQWTYDYNVNVNEGGPRRTFRVAVTARGPGGTFEGPAASLTVSNPAPAEITPVLDSTSEVLFVELPKVADADFVGYLVWVSETPGINPLTAPSFDVGSNSFPYRGVADRTYYVRAAAYDAFSKDPAQLNVSAEQSKKLTIQLFDPTAPAIPGQPTVVSNVAETAPDGTVTSRVTISWPAVTSNNLGFYDGYLAEGNNPADSGYVGGRQTTGTQLVISGLMPGKQYSFKVRAESKNGFAVSGMSPLLVFTAAANTTAPSNPTDATVTGGFERAFLTWVNGTQKDIAYIEVWAFDGNSAAAAPPVGSVMKQVAYPGTFYQEAMPTTGVRTYWLRSVNTSGTAPTSYTRAGVATSSALIGAQMAAGIVDATKLASSIAVNTVVATLPATKTTDYVTFNGEQYRWNAATGSYTKAVSAADISGKVAAAQIDTVNAGQIAGQVQAAQIASVAAGQVTGQLTDAQVAGISASKIGGLITTDQIASLSTAKLAGQIITTQITDNAITTGKIGAGQVLAGNIAAGAVTTSKLTVASNNLIFNSDLSQGLKGFQLGYKTHTLTANLGINNVFGHAGRNAVQIGIPGKPEDNQTQFVGLFRVNPDGTWVDAFPVIAGNSYEFSVYVNAYRAKRGYVFINWTNSSGTLIAQSEGNYITPATATVAGPLVQSQRSSIIMQAPPGAAIAYLFLVATFNGVENSPDVFFTAPMFAVARLNQTEPSPYVSGDVTSIDGSQIVTGTLSAAKIVAESITAGQLAANAITTPKIAAGAVVTSHMTAGSINADRLVAQSVTAGLIAGSTITGDKIAGRTISAGNIVTGTLTGNEIQANSVNADRLVANSITAAKIAAGAIGADQIAANAIQASKLLLSTKNMINNSDMASGIWNYGLGFQNHGLTAALNWGSTFGVGAPMRSLTINVSGTPANDTAQFLNFFRVYSNGVRTDAWDIAGGQRYEFSIYGNVYRGKGFYCAFRFQNADATQSQDFNSAFVTGAEYAAALKPSRRAFVIAQAPAWATKVYLIVWAVYNGVESGPDAYFSAPMFAVAQAGQTEPSPYVSGDITAIEGGTVITGTLHANKIVTNSITTTQIAVGGIHADRIVANSIWTNQIEANGVHADRLIAGSITAREIAANSITSTRLAVQTRPIQIAGVDFYVVRDGNGTLLGRVGWTGGYITWMNDSGGASTVQIPGGEVWDVGSTEVNFWWDVGANYMSWTKGSIETAIGPNKVPMAQFWGGNNLRVQRGAGVLIDGGRITAMSIDADKIQANAIQTRHMAANSIHGDRIIAGSIVADKITSGTLGVHQNIYLGNGNMRISSGSGNGGYIAFLNTEQTLWRMAMGNLSLWGYEWWDYGLVGWDTDGSIAFKVASSGCYLKGAIIGNLEVTNAKIQDLTIGNEKVQNNAITNGAASVGAAFQRDREVWLTIRRAGTRVGVWVTRTGNPSVMSLASSAPGLLRTLVCRPGEGWTYIRDIPNAFTFEYIGNGNAIRHMPTSDMSQVDCNVAGVWGFRVIDDSNADASAASITVVEFSK